MSPIKLSVVIITFNEEKNIGRCIDSVIDIADDIVVVDSFSSDNTERICKKMGIRFIKHQFEDHIEQKIGQLHRQNSHIYYLLMQMKRLVIN